MGVRLFHRMTDHVELVGINHHHSSYKGRHRFIEQPRVAGHFHGDFVRAPQLLKEARQLLQTPLTQAIPSVLQPNAAGKAAPSSSERTASKLNIHAISFQALKLELREPPTSALLTIGYGRQCGDKNP